MIRVDQGLPERVSQGDIFRDIEVIDRIIEQKGEVHISYIKFPYVVVLTQDCDLQQDMLFRKKLSDIDDNLSKKSVPSNDKMLFSAIVAPLYNEEHFFLGNHLEQLNMKMQEIKKTKTPGKDIMNNSNPRYHYLKFDSDVTVVDSVIDFKHYFTVNLDYLTEQIGKNRVASISELYRENISHRFAFFLSRIGLPNAP